MTGDEIIDQLDNSFDHVNGKLYDMDGASFDVT